VDDVDDETSPDIDDCAREPIHVIGNIQSHGLLLALSEPDLIVRHVSANVETLLDISAESLLDQSLEVAVGPSQFETFRAYISSGGLNTANPLRMHVGTRALTVDCLAHRQDGALIIEFEVPHGARSLGPVNITEHVRLPFSRMEREADIAQLSATAASEIQRLSGFARVIVYRFDEGWDGDVLAEAASMPTRSYLGLRFPAGDIPAQVRKLFLINPVRAIADAGSMPVPIIPNVIPSTEKPLDLTHSCLRSPSPLHAEYMRNMGVQSSITVSIIVRNRLWGLILCHHPAPRRTDWALRLVCRHVGEMLGSRIATVNERNALHERLAFRTLLDKCMPTMAAARPAVDAATQGARYLELLNSDGVISCIGGVVSFYGATVAEALLRPVIGELRELAVLGVASSRVLSELHVTAERYTANASGALYIGLDEQCGDYVLLLRREHVETITWAGDREKDVSAAAQGKLRPRTSFAPWRETVRGHSRPWTENDLDNARLLRERLLRMPASETSRRTQPSVRVFRSPRPNHQRHPVPRST